MGWWLVSPTWSWLVVDSQLVDSTQRDPDYPATLATFWNTPPCGIHHPLLTQYMPATLWNTPPCGLHHPLLNSCRDMVSLKRHTFTGYRPTTCLSLISSSRDVDSHPPSCLHARASLSVTHHSGQPFDCDASTAMDPHRDEHVDTTMTHRHDHNWTC